MTMTSREKQRSVLAKLYTEIDSWPVEDRNDWITLHISEIQFLYQIAKSDALKELYTRFGIQKKKFLAGRPSSKSS